MVAGKFLFFFTRSVPNLITTLQGTCPTLPNPCAHRPPCQASSVPCEQLFSDSKQTADNLRASLGSERFEELQIMKFAWHKKINDLSALNSAQIEEVHLDDDLDEYREMFIADKWAVEFDN